MTLASNKDDIFSVGLTDRFSDRVTSIRDFVSIRRAGQHCCADSSRILTAWIVIRDDH